MTALLLAAALVFQHEPKPLPTLEVGHNVWVLGSDGWGRDVRIDWGAVTGFWGDAVTVDGQLLEWDCPLWRVKRIGDK